MGCQCYFNRISEIREEKGTPLILLGLFIHVEELLPAFVGLLESQVRFTTIHSITSGQ
jgi:hypothetical protein